MVVRCVRFLAYLSLRPTPRVFAMSSSAVVEVCNEEGVLLAKVRVGETKVQALERLGAQTGVLKDRDGVGLLNDDIITAEGGPYVFKSGQGQNQQIGNDLVAELQALRLEVHGVRETLPTVLVGHVITPSQASRIPQVVASVFDSLGLSLNPRKTESVYVLPAQCGDKWNFSWKWPNHYTGGDDRGLERTSYHPVMEYLQKLGFFCANVSEGQLCVEKLLFNSDIFTSRKDNPMTVRGQRVYLKHRIQGRSDLAVLRRDNHGGYILRNMIKFAVEIKTVSGYQQSKTGCTREAQLQVIGLNAFNTQCSPPVVLSNLASIHKVFFLCADSEWRYEIRVQECKSFAAAIHFAKLKSEEGGISEHFSRPATPDSPD